MKSNRARLTDEQRLASTVGVKRYRKKPHRALVIDAGAGTGKTEVLAQRVVNLVANGVDPSRILVLAFGVDAAKELRSRISKSLSRGLMQDVEPSIMTFHAFAASFVRRYPRQAGFGKKCAVLDRFAAIDLMDFVRENDKSLPPVQDLLLISSQKANAGSAVAQVLNARWGKYVDGSDSIQECLRKFRKEKRRQNVVDYDDMLVGFRRLLKTPSQKRTIQDSFDYVLVDEFQDLSPVQLAIVRLLRPNGRGLTVVGDDAQAIYGFRGGGEDNVASFASMFPGNLKRLHLRQNFRSSQAILDICNVLLPAERHLRSTGRSGQKPRIVSVLDEKWQAKYVAESIERDLKRGISLGQQAVLFREWQETLSLQDELCRRKISFRADGNRVAERDRGPGDCLAVLRYAINGRDRGAAYRVLKLLVRRADKARRIAISSPSIHSDSVARKTWLKFSKLARNIRAQSEYPAKAVRKVVSWYKSFRKTLPYTDAEFSAWQRSADAYSSVAEFVQNVSSETSNLKTKSDKVSLCTFHSAKGREWKVVRILNCIDSFIPSHHATTQKQLLEEKRLAFVGMSRAVDRLELIVPRQLLLPTKQTVNPHRSEFLSNDLMKRCRSAFHKPVGKAVPWLHRIRR